MQCKIYWSFCSIPTCYSIRQDDKTVCSGFGKCDGPNKCQCQGGYSGEQCYLFCNSGWTVVNCSLPIELQL